MVFEDRLSFSLDVNQYQRNHYISDQFSMRHNKLNGHIAFVQGHKKPEQKMVQVLPRLRVSAFANISIHISMLKAC